MTAAAWSAATTASASRGSAATGRSSTATAAARAYTGGTSAAGATRTRGTATTRTALHAAPATATITRSGTDGSALLLLHPCRIALPLHAVLTHLLTALPHILRALAATLPEILAAFATSLSKILAVLATSLSEILTSVPALLTKIAPAVTPVHATAVTIVPPRVPAIGAAPSHAATPGVTASIPAGTVPSVAVEAVSAAAIDIDLGILDRVHLLCTVSQPGAAG